MSAIYFSGQGKVFWAQAINGVPGKFDYLGNVPDLKVSFSTDVIEHTESVTGNRVQDLRITKNVKVGLSFMIEEYTLPNLVKALYGSQYVESGAVYSGEILPSGLVSGDYVRLDHPNVTGLTLRDSSGTGTGTLVASGDYSLSDPSFGTVQILGTGSGSGYVQPLKATYTGGASTGVTFFTSARQNVFLRFIGLNTADGNRPVMIELYRCSLDPAKTLDMITDDLTKLEMSGSALFERCLPADPTLGGFGRMVYLTAPIDNC